MTRFFTHIRLLSFIDSWPAFDDVDPHPSPPTMLSTLRVCCNCLAWLFQMAASLSWIISVIIYDSYETGDIFQLLAAVSWFLSNMFALPEVLTSLYELFIPDDHDEKRSGSGASDATISAAQLAKVDATYTGNDAATVPGTTTKTTIDGAAEVEMTEKSAAATAKVDTSDEVAGASATENKAAVTADDATAAAPAAEDKSTEAVTES